ncbi:MAG: hypothetical protein CL777_06185 [Chloroflexi bacterium]|jgi:uncharacterized membrane protein YraQ (UPF0718 family)|nr:hypothetical protein [Chloroflexota bacterium]MBI68315.1 hypothetical protein [Chloroflexota bacterium]MCH2531716.1 permease [Dehalococcoidia bacterium]HCH36003.1 hypothetical protein [Dehalococcoidia bacterium]|tara:strand:- start:3494 stop:3988 length:495 start_codon:yes stop_codon:yes gene_type:complete
MSTYLLAVLVLLASVFVLQRHGFSGIREGVITSALLLKTVGKMLILGMALSAMTQVILPEEIITKWMGNESGLTGILIGTVVGVLIPGGPYVVIPLAGSVFLSGAGVGPVAAFITAWNTIPITRTVMWEWPFLGGAFTWSRMIVNLPFPFVAGFLSPPIFNLIK